MAIYDPANVAGLEVKAWQAYHHSHKLRLTYYLIQLQMALFDLRFSQAKIAVSWMRQAMRTHVLKESYEAGYYLAMYYDFISMHVDEAHTSLLKKLQKAQWPLVHDYATEQIIQDFYNELSIDVR